VTASQSQPYKLMSAATLSGYPVRSRSNDDLGCIEEFIVDPQTGKIAYTVLSLAGLPGVAGKLYAVPWSGLELDADQRVFVLNADRHTIEGAPGFHEEEWPDFTDQGWGSQIHGYYGLRPYWEQA